MTRPLFALAVMAAAAAGQTTHTVDQVSLTFDPFNVDLRVGDTVEWVWQSFGDHTVTEGDDGTIDGDEAFNEALTFANPLVSITFTPELFDQLTVNPGNVVDYFCAPHFAFGMTGTLTFEPWIDRGFGLAGTGGLVPVHDGIGPMTSGSGNQFVFADMLPNSTLFLFVGIGTLEAPFKGGVLYPDFIIPPIALPTTPLGELTLPFTLPPGLPSGLSLHTQAWIQDPGGPKGFSATNGLEAHLP